MEEETAVRFEYTYRNTPRDFWLFYMGNIYRNWTGIINVIFTAAFLVLLVRRWADAPLWGCGILVFAVLAFPVLQPLAVWGRSVRESERITEDTTLLFDKAGMHIAVKEHRQTIPWNSFFDRGLVKLKGILAVIPDGMHAYLLPDRVTGADRERLAAFITEMCGKERRG